MALAAFVWLALAPSGHTMYPPDEDESGLRLRTLREPEGLPVVVVPVGRHTV